MAFLAFSLPAVPQESKKIDTMLKAAPLGVAPFGVAIERLSEDQLEWSDVAKELSAARWAISLIPGPPGTEMTTYWASRSLAPDFWNSRRLLADPVIDSAIRAMPQPRLLQNAAGLDLDTDMVRLLVPARTGDDAGAASFKHRVADAFKVRDLLSQETMSCAYPFVPYAPSHPVEVLGAGLYVNLDDDWIPVGRS
ncbi:hypothetical protein AYL99_12012 [Fonsecaea erecta]|uniref:Uncharacterized protein n=1 Tax=Fonsecaea erecta TaxID=1367422 RepID=A0A178Z3K9_9EURO|nr:hypothetical protein AYL99_12012 [Fonsecaea erecta]OAP53793.1 hypothetical protein AYL99_12012 [Fonsecaea erecta]